MKSSPLSVAAGITALAVLSACSGVTEVSTTELAQVIERDGIAFSGTSLPAVLLDRLAANKLVIIGETHHLREHREFVADLVRQLHARGFRQILLEWPQAADWVLTDYVNDGGLNPLPEWEPSATLGGRMITAIRDFNRTLAHDEHFQVRAIDINLDDYGGATDFLASFRAYTDQLPVADPIQAFFQGPYDTPEVQRARVEDLRNALAGERPTLVGAWGQERFDVVAEMVEVELASVGVRALYGERYDAAVRMRESAIKRLADLRLQGYAHRSLINIGGNHAQKSYLKGTDQEWLGDYLVHASDAVGGTVIVLHVLAARIVPEPGSNINFNVLDASPENEVFRLMSEIWPQQTVFLPFDDSLFGRDGVLMNFEGTIYAGSPAQVYDAFLQYPLANSTPIR